MYLCQQSICTSTTETAAHIATKQYDLMSGESHLKIDGFLQMSFIYLISIAELLNSTKSYNNISYSEKAIKGKTYIPHF